MAVGGVGKWEGGEKCGRGVGRLVGGWERDWDGCGEKI